MKEYKIVHREIGDNQQSSIVDLENELNELAKDGWRVAISQDTILKTKNGLLLVIMEK